MSKKNNARRAAYQARQEKEVKARKIELATVRLIIRTPQERDVHDIFVLMSDLEIAAITGFRPMNTLSEAEGKIRREMDGGLMFCILEKNLARFAKLFRRKAMHLFYRQFVHSLKI